jgi:hypothetical protein
MNLGIMIGWTMPKESGVSCGGIEKGRFWKAGKDEIDMQVLGQGGTREFGK